MNVRIPSGCMGLQPSSIRGPCAIGCDVRPGSWDVVIADLIRNPKSQLRVVRPVFIGKVEDDEQVEFVMRQYKVRFGGIDTRPETTLAKRLQTRAAPLGIKLWRCEYNTAPSTIEVTENEAEGLLKLDRTLTLDAVHYSFMTGGTVLLPQNFRQVTGGQFTREMTSASRVPIKWQGRDAYSWAKQGPDHVFHAWNYLLVAIGRSNMLAYGGELTAMAHRGIVEGSLKKNLVNHVDSGDPKKRDRLTAHMVDWDGIMNDQVDNDEGLFLEA